MKEKKPIENFMLDENIFQKTTTKRWEQDQDGGGVNMLSHSPTNVLKKKKKKATIYM